MSALLRNVRYARSSLTSNLFAALLINVRLNGNIYLNGPYRIRGTVTRLNIAGSYRVRLFRRNAADCIREVWSSDNGSYEFKNIAYLVKGYFVVAFDLDNNPLNAAIADLVTPEPMS